MLIQYWKDLVCWRFLKLKDKCGNKGKVGSLNLKMYINLLFFTVCLFFFLAKRKKIRKFLWIIIVNNNDESMNLFNNGDIGLGFVGQRYHGCGSGWGGYYSGGYGLRLQRLLARSHAVWRLGSCTRYFNLDKAL